MMKICKQKLHEKNIVQWENQNKVKFHFKTLFNRVNKWLFLWLIKNLLIACCVIMNE